MVHSFRSPLSAPEFPALPYGLAPMLESRFPKLVPNAVGSPAGRKGRILVAEDDSDLRFLTRAFLIEEGYEVFACANGQRALEIAQRRDDIDLLITDFQMPFLNGMELAAACKELRPELPVILASGSVMDDVQLANISMNDWTFLPKPVPVPRLLSVVRRLVPDAPRPVVL